MTPHDEIRLRTQAADALKKLERSKVCLDRATASAEAAEIRASHQAMLNDMAHQHALRKLDRERVIALAFCVACLLACGSIVAVTVF